MPLNCNAGKTFKSPLECKETKLANPKGSQPWILIGRTDADTEAPIVWGPDAKSWFTRKDSDAGKDWRQKEKGMEEDMMVRWQHWLNWHEFEQTLGDSGGYGSLACYSSWNQSQTWQRDWTTAITHNKYFPWFYTIWNKYNF